MHSRYTTRSDLLHPATRLEGERIVALPAGDDRSQRPAVPVDGLMDLRGQAATGTADPVHIRR